MRVTGILIGLFTTSICYYLITKEYLIRNTLLSDALCGSEKFFTKLHFQLQHFFPALSLTAQS